ncbi:hypothetical protein O1611_g10025 [Lasiodiplodia mahajangana]|uniref:Uncharacterized protein n=1 Tax=Lasiodiplodia mahajangana TaxID=1108764 RepID=A0ACC2J319_9PEZI|nr:hypothetical protein O1611_g10025 [Lasiodiplodia mahajangana]
MAEVKQDTSGTGTAPMAPPAKKNHFKRFWWAYLLVFLVVATVVIVPSVLLVAVPRMAQQRLNAAKLTIDGIAITHTQTDSLAIAINSTIRADDSVHATIDPFKGTLYLANVSPPLAFAEIDFPQTSSASRQAVNVSQEMQVLDINALTAFNTVLLTNDSVSVQVKGDTHIHVRGISRAYSVTFDKTVTLKGLSNFEGLTISDPSINALSTDNNFNATAHIPNPSVLTLEIGNTTFTTYFNGSEIGQATIADLVLYPGNNIFPIRGDIQQLPIINALTQEPFCELSGNLPFQLSGNNVVNNGQVIAYFRDALASTNQSVTIDLSDAARKVGIPVGCNTTPGN